MANLQMGIIGCGGRGRGHMRCLDSFDDVDLAAGSARVRVHSHSIVAGGFPEMS